MSQVRRKNNKEWFDITKDVSLRMNIPQDVVERIFASQFKLVKETMQDGSLECVKLMFLGKFAVKPNRMEYVKKISETIKRKRAEQKKLLEDNGESTREPDRVEDSQ